jgi:hypothetical protein
MNCYTSDELFHFVGRSNPSSHDHNYETLSKIIDSGWVSAPPHIKGWGPHSYRLDLSRTLESGELIQPAITCYCDIPIAALEIHVAKYGHFGLSFKRETLVKYGARPVTYFPISKTDPFSPYGKSLLRDIEATYRSFIKHLAAPVAKSHFSRGHGSESATPEDTIRALRGTLERDFIAFIKPFNADLPLDHPDNYYLEREWRKLGNMEVTIDTLNRVVVKQGYETRFAKAFPQFQHLVHSLN